MTAAEHKLDLISQKAPHIFHVNHIEHVCAEDGTPETVGTVEQSR